MGIEYVVLFGLCLVPILFPQAAMGDGDDPKSRNIVFAAALIRFAPLLIAAVLVTTYGGWTVLRTLEFPVWVQRSYVVALGSFWVACVFKNLRDLRGLFDANSPKKPAGQPDDRLK